MSTQPIRNLARTLSGPARSSAGVAASFVLTLVLAGLTSGPVAAADATAGSPPPKGHVAKDPARYFGIRVIDEATGRGVPLVELETTNQLRWVTDSGGWVAIDEPGLFGEKVFVSVRAHGYEHAKDGFGFPGVALRFERGEKATVKVRRINIAERLYRSTGEGTWRDSILLGEPCPVAEPLGSGKVTGQDSAFAVPYRGKIHWFWGDTGRLSYPLGHFWMAGATSDFPGKGGLDPSVGVNLSYLVGTDGFSRPVARLGVEGGPVWIDAVCVVPDSTGKDRLFCHWAHMQSLERMLGHGLALWDDEASEFRKTAELPMDQLWRFPGQAHPVRLEAGGKSYLALGEVFPTVRVPAQVEILADPGAFEAWSPLEPGSTLEAPKFLRRADGQIDAAWRKGARPVDVGVEWRWIEEGKIRAEEASFVPVDVDTGKRVRLHRGTVAWNEYRSRWILIACQIGGTSQLGEIYYGEAREATGPWTRVKKIVTHDRYSFYNPVHHPFFDEAGGRRIYFEGTYTMSFSGNPNPTPRYDYNQIVYRLDLDDPRLRAARLEGK